MCIFSLYLIPFITDFYLNSFAIRAYSVYNFNSLNLLIYFMSQNTIYLGEPSVWIDKNSYSAIVVWTIPSRSSQSIMFFYIFFIFTFFFCLPFLSVTENGVFKSLIVIVDLLFSSISFCFMYLSCVIRSFYKLTFFFVMEYLSGKISCSEIYFVWYYYRYFCFL